MGPEHLTTNQPSSSLQIEEDTSTQVGTGNQTNADSGTTIYETSTTEFAVEVEVDVTNSTKIETTNSSIENSSTKDDEEISGGNGYKLFSFLKFFISNLVN